mmetsp:Transcript_71288/g.133349  ORF Transcript_71288/g.133349 Transcript_71288/m.133349 type:complete len:81 (-) Transcript_71288:103-345(-)
MDEASEVERAQALMQMQTLLTGQKATLKILGQCFDKCVDEPGNELAFKEQQCIWNCTQRLFDTEQFLTRRLMAAQKQKAR